METLLRFLPLGLDSLLGTSERSRSVPDYRPPVSAVGETTQATVPTASAANISRNQSGFRQLEKKAAALGVKMAAQGFVHEDNPYAGLNHRLETVWLSGFSKYRAKLNVLDVGLVETRRIELPTFALRTRRSPS